MVKMFFFEEKFWLNKVTVQRGGLSLQGSYFCRKYYFFKAA